MWHERTHTIINKGRVYEYPMIKATLRLNGKHLTFARTYGNKRTKEEAIELVENWYEATKATKSN